MTQDDTAVILIAEALDDAYADGFDRFEGFDTVDDEPADLEGFRGGATYANHVLPRLRAAAGYTDPTGAGTYTGHRDVVVVEPGDEGDRPMPGTTVPSGEVFQELAEAWDAGARDALEGNDRGETALPA